MDMEHIMDASFGEVASTIKATYRKTVQVRQYESEVIEIETVLDVGNSLSGSERMLISAMLQAQLEYAAYCNLAYKGLVTGNELNSRKHQLEEGVTALKIKAEEVHGKPLDNLIL